MQRPTREKPFGINGFAPTPGEEARAFMFGLTRAPEIARQGLTWFNTPEPLSLADLRGRVVLLDFWTPCCVNCHQARPTLLQASRSIGPAVTLIGVLSPKFPWERHPKAAARAIERLEIPYPVIHDPDRVLWDQYAVRAWPTLVLIDPKGMVVGHLPGEPDPDRLESGLRRLIRRAMEAGTLDPPTPASDPIPTSVPPPAPTDLRFPTGLRAGPWPGTLALADSGNHRVVILDGQGEAQLSVGGTPGFVDGPLGEARFHAPQAALGTPDGAAVLVADTGNHALRRIDLIRGRVETLAGQGWRGPPLLLGQPAREAVLASPWDLALDDDILYFSNTGTHQLGRLDLTRNRLRPLAGTGQENLVDGPLDEALFSQPSGLALDRERRILWVCDAEASALRAVHLGTPQRVETALGLGLFTFGEADGDRASARAQHPTALTLLADGSVILADSYNHRLRRWDPATGHLATLSGPWAAELEGAEPRGLHRLDSGALAVSLSNHHRLLTIPAPH